MDHKITGSSGKDGKTWWSSANEEWQRWWCGVDHNGDGRKCSVSIPRKTGRTR